MSARREVRVSEEFFRQLDRQLGASRGPSGEPSATDYLVIELPAIVERFAVDFDHLAEVVEGVPSARMLLTTGLLVRASAVYGLELSEGVVELVGIELDLGRS
ncbi:MAG: hypothetical protein U5R31_13385 [Acidimicrobiia bacterium]|nr:hypothetical protein [Acidimicrobiia bacterium]